MINDKQLRSAKPCEREYELNDGNGLKVRIKPKGQKQFFHRYTFAGRERRKIIGYYSEISLAQAREIVRDEKKMITAGSDPIRKRAEIRSRLTVADFYIEFRERYLEAELKNPSTQKWILNKDILPYIGPYDISSVTRRDLITVLDRVWLSAALASRPTA